MKTRHWGLATLVATTLLSVGCGGGGGLNSGVPGDKQADELSSQEIQDICEAVGDYLEAEIDTDETFCRTFGVTAAALVYGQGLGLQIAKDSCSELYDNCIEDPEGTLGGAGVEIPTLAPDCSQAPESVENCSVTVEEYETCATDAVDAVAKAFQEIPVCDSLTEDDLENSGDILAGLEVDPPASCEAVDAAECEGIQSPF